MPQTPFKYDGARLKMSPRLLGLAAALLGVTPALAGPPYITDDPEPTETGHWENYLFVEGARVAGQPFTPIAGVEINYGAFENTQLTLSLPLNTNPGAGGIGVVWSPLGMGVKYRFIEEDEDGWRPQVAFFPSVSIPIGPANDGAPVTELLPIWMQKSLGDWTLFGGGGYTNNPGPGNRGFANFGVAVQRQVAANLALGVEFFGAGKDADDGRASMGVGLAALYDISDVWHVVSSVNTGVNNAQEADQFSYNLALKWTP